MGETPSYDLAGQIIGLAMKVHSTLGGGFLESVYQNALAFELTRAGMAFQTSVPLKVKYEGAIVGEFEADMLIANTLIIENKAVQTLAVAHEVQLVNYLTATGINEGLLLNFGAEKLQFKKKFRTYRAAGPN
ncbi:GxxExxY protein [Ereboglobus luteus]|uniref:GxxExxY protein n=1 Tax=Ereboglobus luteus TaxID=1796921 RepID=A0A2U8E753_9BACT|nr:GxxExxY protein [Ereboglobus luteus]AWI10424.1 GxxExxY protein [Ereboglobus luteus]